MKQHIRLGVAAGLLAGSLFAATPLAAAPPGGPTAIWEVNVKATVNGLVITVLKEDNEDTGWPRVFYSLDLQTVHEIPLAYADYLGDDYYLAHYRLDMPLACGARGVISVFDFLRGSSEAVWSRPFVDFPGVHWALMDFEVRCDDLLGSIRGTAYKNGAPYGGAWYKITDGGNWYVCGTVGGDGTFGVPVTAGAYYIIPLDQPGLKASGVMKVVVEAGKVYLGNDITYTSDPSAKHESCDLYNPPRPIPTSVR